MVVYKGKFPVENSRLNWPPFPISQRMGMLALLFVSRCYVLRVTVLRNTYIHTYIHLQTNKQTNKQ